VSPILLVDSAARERRKLNRTLTLEEYPVRTARDSREAVRLFIAHPADLPLVSQRESGLDGVVTFELLSAIKPCLPVIVVTAAAPQRVLSNRLSIRVMIEKPSGLPVLFNLLRQLLQRPAPTNHDGAPKAAAARN
jgi:DNA-binding NtrC family response regulator